MPRLLLALLILPLISFSVRGQRLLERSGTATFFSEAPVENITATNEQVLAIVDLENGKVAVSMLMKGFQFRKALMQEHFNESYVESDEYPKASFTGVIQNYSPGLFEKEGTIRVRGEITIHGVTQPLESEVSIRPAESGIEAETSFSVTVADFDIKIPSVVSNNIAEVVEVNVSLTLKKQ